MLRRYCSDIEISIQAVASVGRPYSRLVIVAPLMRGVWRRAGDHSFTAMRYNESMTGVKQPAGDHSFTVMRYYDWCVAACSPPFATVMRHHDDALLSTWRWPIVLLIHCSDFLFQCSISSQCNRWGMYKLLPENAQNGSVFDWNKVGGVWGTKIYMHYLFLHQFFLFQTN